MLHHFNDKKHEKTKNDTEYDSRMDEETVENLSTGDLDNDDRNDFDGINEDEEEETGEESVRDGLEEDVSYGGRNSEEVGVGV